MEVKINDNIYGAGTGRNKKTAEREAAKIAYEKLTDA
jgi:dsRNA-specific ribonuclease